MFRETLRRHFNFTVPTRIGSRSYRIPVWGGMETPGVPAAWHLDFYSRLLGVRPGAFVDGGMNLGQTLLTVRAVDQTAPYFGFEPNPKCVAYLECLTMENGLEGVTVVPSGLSNSSGIRRLYFPPEDSAHPSATLVKNLRPHATGHPSRVISVSVFDDVTQDIGAETVGFVKIDVEGHELEALEGMARTFAKDRPLGFVEVLPRVGGTSPEETEERRARLEKVIAGWRYDIRRVVPGRRGSSKLTLETFTEFKGLPWDPEESYDYLLIPEESIQQVEALFKG